MAVHKSELSTKDYLNKTESIVFSIGGMAGRDEVTIFKKAGRFYFQGGGNSEYVLIRKLNKRTWKELLNQLFSELNVQEWESSYVNPTIMDGTQWKLKIGLEGNIIISYYGSNKYPPNWEKAYALFSPYIKEIKANGLDRWGYTPSKMTRHIKKRKSIKKF